ncbi:Slp family lipoprotein [Desulfatiglans anilini]|uniref:Slp family lipoprotein n=1 Tax=Desulfatiglans anilini TaxID=90728 RepID=UPI0003FEC923|nr:Slp family lipoprotein [Desulfatiglans anilini]
MKLKIRLCIAWFLLTACLAVAAGCATVISREALQSADRSLPFSTLAADPGAFSGTTVILGGQVVETKNLPGKSLIFVVQRAIDSRQKPKPDSESRGRFLISVEGFLDPAIYRAGRWITVVGTVAGSETRPLGEIQYTYPVIAEREHHLWPVKGVAPDAQIHFGIGIGFGF